MQYNISGIELKTSEVPYSGSADDIENAFFLLLSHLTSLEIDNSLFKHTLPLTVCDAVCCKLTGELPSPAPGIRLFSFDITTRASGMSSDTLGKIKNLLMQTDTPLNLQVSAENITAAPVINAITFDGVWKYSTTAFGGVRVPVLSAKINVYVSSAC